MKGIKAFISALFICTNFRQYNVLANNLSSINQKMTATFNCDNGIRLSSSVCIPQDYLKGEVPAKPTVVSSKIEINNLREVDDKRMRITLDFYQELKWTDNRIKTNLPNDGVSVLNNHLLSYIWKPDLWIMNLFDFKLHGVLEPTAGLVISERNICESEDCTNGQRERNTFVNYN